MKLTKKFIAIMLTLVFVLSMVLPMGVLADTTDERKTVSFGFTTSDRIDFGYTSTSGSTGNIKNNTRVYHKEDTWHVRSGYPAHAKIDFSGYEEILKNEGTTVYFQTKGSNSSYPVKDFIIYLAADNCDMLDFTVLSNVIATSEGFYNTSRPVLYMKSDGTSATSIFSSGEIKTTELVSVLDENPENSSVALYLSHLNGVQNRFKPAETSFNIIYDESIINNQEYVNSVAERLTWDILSSEDKNMVTSKLNFPKKFYGVDIVWESSKPDVINESSGEVVVDSDAAIPVTLTANLTYTNAFGDSAVATAPVTFNVIVRDPASIVKDQIISLENVAHSRDQNGEKPLSVSEYEGNNYIQFRQGGQSNTRYGYGQFDLSGYEEILDNAGTELKTVFKAYGGTYVMKDFQVFIMNDSVDDYVASDLSYDLAEEMGMHEFENGTLLYYRSDATSATSLESSVNRIDVVDKLKTGTDNSLVTLVFDSLSNNTSRIFYEYADNGLYITYDKTEINNAEYLKEVKDALTWEVLSKGKQDKVSADLYLPTKFKGAKIVWESNDAAITADGKVDFANNKGKTVKLTAKMTYTNILGQSAETEKEFEVTISDGEYYEIGTPELKIEDNKFKASWGVENYTGADVTYYVYLAAYSNKELVGLKPIEYVAKNGEPTFINPEVKFQEGYTAKLIVLKSDHITPLFAATEK
jgi:hypothetical protein